MAYGLNPYYHYKNEYHFLDHEVVQGVLKCIDVLFPGDDEMQNKIIMEELPRYKNKTDTFGKSNVVRACSDVKFDPVEWWSFFGTTPNLQRLAMRILSLSTSSSGCERNWSAFEGVHTKKRNRLNPSLLNNLVFIQFNARLFNKQKKRKIEMMLMCCLPMMQIRHKHGLLIRLMMMKIVMMREMTNLDHRNLDLLENYMMSFSPKMRRKSLTMP